MNILQNDIDSLRYLPVNFNNSVGFFFQRYVSQNRVEHEFNKRLSEQT